MRFFHLLANPRLPELSMDGGVTLPRRGHEQRHSHCTTGDPMAVEQHGGDSIAMAGNGEADARRPPAQPEDVQVASSSSMQASCTQVGYFPRSSRFFFYYMWFGHAYSTHIA
jgi:hypothetical protein